MAKWALPWAWESEKEQPFDIKQHFFSNLIHSLSQLLTFLVYFDSLMLSVLVLFSISIEKPCSLILTVKLIISSFSCTFILDFLSHISLLIVVNGFYIIKGTLSNTVFNFLRQYGLPVDIIDLSTGQDPQKLIDFLQMVRKFKWVLYGKKVVEGMWHEVESKSMLYVKDDNWYWGQVWKRDMWPPQLNSGKCTYLHCLVLYPLHKNGLHL